MAVDRQGKAVALLCGGYGGGERCCNLFLVSACPGFPVALYCSHLVSPSLYSLVTEVPRHCMDSDLGSPSILVSGSISREEPGGHECRLEALRGER